MPTCVNSFCDVLGRSGGGRVEYSTDHASPLQSEPLSVYVRRKRERVSFGISLGFSVREFVATAQLALNLYRYCYRVSRDDPRFTLVLGTIKTTIELLAAKAHDPELTTAGGGEQ